MSPTERATWLARPAIRSKRRRPLVYTAHNTRRLTSSHQRCQPLKARERNARSPPLLAQERLLPQSASNLIHPTPVSPSLPCCTWPCGGLTHSAAFSEPGLRILMQDKFCLATAYKDAKLSKCTSCSRRNGKDTCRFRDIRYIKRDAAGAFRGIGFKTKPAQTLGRVRFPDSWNEKPRKEHVNIIKVGAALSSTFHRIADLIVKRVVAAGLLPVLQREIKHLEHQDTICRPREIDVRATCGKEPHRPPSARF